MITSLYAGIAALWFALLSVRVIALRGNPIFSFLAFGNLGDSTLNRAIRAHGNFAEYAPIILIMMYILETQNASSVLLHAIGLLLISGRLMHGICFGFMESNGVLRVGGTALTLTALITSAVSLLA
jgi:uncharacterized membrane protein YecN with MAPEG domain